MAVYTYSNIDENRFWIQVMGENAEMLYNRLTPQSQKADPAKELSNRFENLYRRANQNTTTEQLYQLNKDVHTAAQELRALILSILKEQVLEGAFINLKPSYINNMISLADAFLNLLVFFMNNKTPVYNQIELDLFWLPVFYTDARLIYDSLGDFPVDFRSRSENLTYRIILLYQTAVSFRTMFQRVGRNDFPIALEYRDAIRAILSMFAELIVDIMNQVRKQRLPGTVALVDLDCMYRKVCYYTRQISAIDNKPMPACDPGTPRLSMVKI